MFFVPYISVKSTIKCLISMVLIFDGDDLCIKVGLSASKKNLFFCFIENLLKMMKNAFYFILKALFVLNIFKFLSRLFGRVG